MTTTVEGAIESKLMDAFDYRSMIKSLKRGNRKTIRLYPDNQTQIYNGVLGNKIKFNFPARGFCDMRNTTLNFTARSTVTGNPATICFSNWIESVINKVTITLGDGSSVVEELQQYNINAISKYKNELSINYSGSLGGDLLGYGTQTARSTLATQAGGAQYAVPLKGSGLWSGNLKYLPMGIMSMAGFNKSLVVEIELESPSVCMINTAGGATTFSYEISNVYIQMELIECPEYEEELMMAVKNGKTIAIPYVTSNYWNNSIQSNQQGDMTFSILQYNQFVHDVRSIFIGNVSATNVDALNIWTKPANTQSYQYQINSKYYPSQAVEFATNSNANSDLEKNKCFNILKEYNNGSLLSQYADGTTTGSTANGLNSESTGFMIAQTFKTFYDNEKFIEDSGDYLLDGINTSDKSAIIFRYRTSGVQTSPLYLHHYVDYQSAVIVDKTGVSIIN
jgi:hypothetical protein